MPARRESLDHGTDGSAVGRAVCTATDRAVLARGVVSNLEMAAHSPTTYQHEVLAAAMVSEEEMLAMAISASLAEESSRSRIGAEAQRLGGRQSNLLSTSSWAGNTGSPATVFHRDVDSPCANPGRASASHELVRNSIGSARLLGTGSYEECDNEEDPITGTLLKDLPANRLIRFEVIPDGTFNTAASPPGLTPLRFFRTLPHSPDTHPTSVG